MQVKSFDVLDMSRAAQGLVVVYHTWTRCRINAVVFANCNNEGYSCGCMVVWSDILLRTRTGRLDWLDLNVLRAAQTTA